MSVATKPQEVLIPLWSPHSGQQALVEDKHRFKLIRSGRRFGKTTYAINTLIEEALLKQDGLYFYIAPTYKQAKMIAWAMLLKAVGKLPPPLMQKINESELYVVIGNNSRICIKGADNPDALRGVGLDGAVLDEYSDIREHVFTDIIEPALTDKMGWCTIIGTPKGFNHFYRLYVKVQTDPTWAVFHRTSYDNPGISREELDRIRVKTPEDTFAQEFLAEFRRFEGLVYKEFDRDRHTFITMPDTVQRVDVIAGVDFGYTNPSAIVVVAQDFDNHYWVIDEWYKNQKLTDEIIGVCKGLVASTKVNIFYPDPAEPDRIEAMNRDGLTTREVNKDVAAGVDRVRSLFKENRLKVSLNCRNLLFELETYHYPERKEGKNEQELPVKENDHAVDALRYALYTHSPLDVREGEQEFNLYGGTYR